MPSEFDLIRRYFTSPAPSAILGVGDDAALVKATKGKVLAISTDMLVSGTHFFADANPYKLGQKSLSVNLSDMAAMGATPRWATLALALPAANTTWLGAFARGFFKVARAYQVDLVGGDTTRGPLAISVTLIGEVAAGKALQRGGAKAGDEIWVSGDLGEAALGLLHLQGRIALTRREASRCELALHAPIARVALGQKLSGIASSAIDISDGLLADLGHLLEQSKVGAEIEFAAIPRSDALQKYLAQTGTHKLVVNALMAGGDDYELCFTAPASKRLKLLKLAQALKMPLTCIGKITARSGLSVRDATGKKMRLPRKGYDHFCP